MIPRSQPLRDYPWSSWPEYLKRPSRRRAWLRVDRLLGEYHIPQDSGAGRRYLEAQMEQRRAAETGTDYRRLRRGWCLGSAAFRQELLAQMADKRGADHYGEEWAESAAERAEQIIAAGLKKARWTEADLQRQRKGHAVKVRLAQQLRKQTLLTVGQIAERLHMGTRGYAVHLLWRAAHPSE